MTNGVKILRDILNNPKTHTDILTINDFFSSIDIPIEHRSGFAFACYLKQALEENSEELKMPDDSSLYLYMLTMPGYTFLIKAPNLVLALEDFIEHMVSNKNNFPTGIDSIEISKLEFLGSVIQI